MGVRLLAEGWGRTGSCPFFSKHEKLRSKRAATAKYQKTSRLSPVSPVSSSVSPTQGKAEQACGLMAGFGSELMVAGGPAVISFTFAIPVVVVFDAAVVPFPIAFEEPLSVVMRAYPSSALVGRPSPIASMPCIVPVYRIPVAFYPDEVGAWAVWADSHDARRRRGTDSDSDGNLSERCGRNDPEHS
jgi:hypothetical protein